MQFCVIPVGVDSEEDPRVGALPPGKPARPRSQSLLGSSTRSVAVPVADLSPGPAGEHACASRYPSAPTCPAVTF